MILRLIRVIIAIIVVITCPFTFIPSLIVWILTDRMYLVEILEWCVLGDEY